MAKKQKQFITNKLLKLAKDNGVTTGEHKNPWYVAPRKEKDPTLDELLLKAGVPSEDLEAFKKAYYQAMDTTILIFVDGTINTVAPKGLFNTPINPELKGPLTRDHIIEMNALIRNNEPFKNLNGNLNQVINPKHGTSYKPFKQKPYLKPNTINNIVENNKIYVENMCAYADEAIRQTSFNPVSMDSNPPAVFHKEALNIVMATGQAPVKSDKRAKIILKEGDITRKSFQGKEVPFILSDEVPNLAPEYIKQPKDDLTDALQSLTNGLGARAEEFLKSPGFEILVGMAKIPNDKKEAQRVYEEWTSSFEENNGPKIKAIRPNYDLPKNKYIDYIDGEMTEQSKSMYVDKECKNFKACVLIECGEYESHINIYDFLEKAGSYINNQGKIERNNLFKEYEQHCYTNGLNYHEYSKETIYECAREFHFQKYGQGFNTKKEFFDSLKPIKTTWSTRNDK